MQRENKTPRISDKTIERSINLSIVQLDEKTFTVASKSKPISGHFVRKDGNNWNCDCQSYAYRGDCSHVTRVEKYLADQIINPP